MSSSAVSHTAPASTGTRPTSAIAFGGIGAAGVTSIAMVALNLRPAVTSIGAVLGDLHMPSWVSTAVVAIPPAVLAAGSLVTARLATRWSTPALLTSSLVVLGAALALRVTSGPAALLTGTVASAFAVAVLGALLPAVVRAVPRRHSRLVTAVYSAAMGAGATSGSLLTPLLSHTTSWRIGAGSWALAAATAAAVVAAAARWPKPSRANKVPTPSATAHRLPWHSRTAWWTATYYGALVGVTITIMGWLPTILRDRLVAPTPAATAFTITMLIGAPVALLLPRLLPPQQALALTAATGIALVGLIGLLRSPGTAPVLWACLIGFALGVFAHGFINILTHATRGSADTARLSAMSQGVGYLIASVCAFITGELHTSTGGWAWPLAFLLIVLTVLGISAVRLTNRSTEDTPSTSATAGNSHVAPTESKAARQNSGRDTMTVAQQPIDDLSTVAAIGPTIDEGPSPAALKRRIRFLVGRRSARRRVRQRPRIWPRTLAVLIMAAVSATGCAGSSGSESWGPPGSGLSSQLAHPSPSTTIAAPRRRQPAVSSPPPARGHRRPCPATHSTRAP